MGGITDDIEDAECVYCFSDDREGQDWIRYVVFNKWAHTGYVDQKLRSLCDCNKGKQLQLIIANQYKFIVNNTTSQNQEPMGAQFGKTMFSSF